MPHALDLPHYVASTYEPRPVVYRRGRSRALAHPSGPSSEHDVFSSCDHRDLKVASHTSRTALLALQVSAEQSVGWMTAMPSCHHYHQSGLFRSGRREAAKTLTGDCSALSWTQELGLTCLESGRRAAWNEPSCFSRRLKLAQNGCRTGLWIKQGTALSFCPSYTPSTKRQKSFTPLRGSRSLKGTALRVGPRWLHPN